MRTPRSGLVLDIRRGHLYRECTHWLVCKMAKVDVTGSSEMHLGCSRTRILLCESAAKLSNATLGEKKLIDIASLYLYSFDHAIGRRMDV